MAMQETGGLAQAGTAELPFDPVGITCMIIQWINYVNKVCPHLHTPDKYVVSALFECLWLLLRTAF